MYLTSVVHTGLRRLAVNTGPRASETNSEQASWIMI
jgi:hypothetical protein